MEAMKGNTTGFAPLQWWVTETLFWVAFGLASFIALTLFYGEPGLTNIADLVFEALLGIVFTRPILLSASRLGKMPVISRSIVLATMVFALSQGWNVARMLTFPVFFPGAEIWNQLGGWAFSAILIFALWTAVFYNFRANQIAATQRELATLERLRRLSAEQLMSNAQLKMLRYQINPHFIFNTLNSVNALIATNRNGDARLMIDKLSDLLRMTLARDPPLIVPLFEELDTARRYLDVEQMRFQDRLTTRFHVPEDAKNVQVPSLILQPLVENAVKHGVEKQTAHCEISVEVMKGADHIVIAVSDTGPGLKVETRESRRESLGLANVLSRLKSVYGGTASFALTDRSEGGARASLVLPLHVPKMFQ
jgi:sensor histidine kinase YesM